MRQCEESTTTKDLYAYLQRIALHCHQLNITSKVKADVQNVSGELIVSGVGAEPQVTPVLICNVLKPSVLLSASSRKFIWEMLLVIALCFRHT